jgi:Zn-dependent peptidase ImmA (M78 family)
MENNVFTREWWTETLQLNEISNDEVIERVVKGFNLVYDKRGFGNSYTTKTGKANIALAKRINVWIKENFPDNNIGISFEKVHGLIRLSENKLYESPPIEFEQDDYQDYTLQNRHKIEKAARAFNLPISDMEYAFNAGREVVLSDEMWDNLQNSKSYGMKSLDDAIQHALKLGIEPKPYIEAIKKGNELPLPLVLCYGPNKYYLVGGEIILSLYRALGSIPTVLQGTLNLQTKQLHQPTSLGEELTENKQYKTKLSPEQLTTLKTFLKYATEELKLEKIPSGLTLSHDNSKAKGDHTFGYFNPETDKIWLYVSNRNMADILRTLAHELVHLKQHEEGRIKADSGKTGSDIENEANAKAGVLLRNFGKQHEEIYESFKKKLNEVGGLELAYPWSYAGIVGKSEKYIFKTEFTEYFVYFTRIEEQKGFIEYERAYFPKGKYPNVLTGEGKPLAINATVMAITINFLNRNKEWDAVYISPIGEQRRKLVISFLNKSLPPEYYFEERGLSIYIYRRENLKENLNEGFKELVLSAALSLGLLTASGTTKSTSVDDKLEATEYCKSVFNDSTLNKAKKYWANWLQDPATVEKIAKNYKTTSKDITQNYIPKWLKIIEPIKIVYKNMSSQIIAGVDTAPSNTAMYVNPHCIVFQPKYREKYQEDAIRTMVHELQHKMTSLIPINPEEVVNAALGERTGKYGERLKDEVLKRIANEFGIDMNISKRRARHYINIFYGSKWTNTYAKSSTEMTSRIDALKYKYGIKPSDKRSLKPEMFKSTFTNETIDADLDWILVVWAGYGFPPFQEFLNGLDTLAINNKKINNNV